MWLNGVIRLRLLIVVVALAFFGSSIYLTTTFTPTDRDFRYETFMEDSNVMRFLNQIEYTYEEFGNSATWVDVVYGVRGSMRAWWPPTTRTTAAACRSGTRSGRQGRRRCSWV